MPSTPGPGIIVTSIGIGVVLGVALSAWIRRQEAARLGGLHPAGLPIGVPAAGLTGQGVVVPLR